MMEMKDLIVGRRANATATYTEVEPEQEEPMGGLAGVRQKGGRWRRITLVCVAMLIVIGVPLFVYLVVRSKVDCKFDIFDRPELIENDITVLQLQSPTDPKGVMAAVFYTMTDISYASASSSFSFACDDRREDSYLFFSLLLWDAGHSQWLTTIPPRNITKVLSQHAYIQSAAVVNGNPLLLIEDWYTGQWSLVEVTNWASETPTFNATYSTVVPEDLNLVYSLQTLTDGTVLLLRENQQETTSDDDAKPLWVTRLPVASDPFQPSAGLCEVDILPDQPHPTFWWSVGAIGGKQYLYSGYDKIARASNGSTVTPVYRVCELNFAQQPCCTPVVPPWGESLNALYWDSNTSLVLIQSDVSGACSWWDLTKTQNQLSAATQDWAVQYCDVGPSARRVNVTHWLQPDMKNHVMQYFRVPMSVINDWNTVPEECFIKGNEFLSTVSSLVTLNLGAPNQLLLWVARPLPEEGQGDELSNWIAVQSLAQQQDTDPDDYDADPLQCPCLPNLQLHPCPPTAPTV